MFIWGHRGCRGIDGLDENTLAACAWALEHGAHGLEFDVQVSSDGIPFVFHDQTLVRVGASSDNRVVESLSWSSLETIKLKQGGRIPRLEEMTVFASQARMNLEVKTLSAVPSVIGYLHGVARDDWVVSSFEFEALSAIREAHPGVELGYLLERAGEETLQDCATRAREQIFELDPQRIHLDIDLCVSPILSSLTSLGIPIHVWTVNSRKRGELLGNQGVVGLFTDDARLFV